MQSLHHLFKKEYLSPRYFSNALPRLKFTPWIVAAKHSLLRMKWTYKLTCKIKVTKLVWCIQDLNEGLLGLRFLQLLMSFYESFFQRKRFNRNERERGQRRERCEQILWPCDLETLWPCRLFLSWHQTSQQF